MNEKNNFMFSMNEVCPRHRGGGWGAGRGGGGGGGENWPNASINEAYKC